MSALSAREVRAVTQLAQALYEFLPGTPHPKADRRLSFPAAAAVAGVGNFWAGGSKLPAISQLLRSTLEHRRDAFCKLVSEIVASAQIYRQRKNPLTRREIERVNDLVRVFEFKIPELWDEQFLQSLEGGAESTVKMPRAEAPSALQLQSLRGEFFGLQQLEPQRRGFAFERTLNELFHAFTLAPRSSFRLVGEQIDGSFDLNGTTYLVEAKWTGPRIGLEQLMVFAGKVQGKARWSRGVLISYAGYTEDGLEAFSRGRATEIICLDGTDLWHVLNGDVDLRKLIDLKARRAVETGEAFIPTRELFANVT